MKVKPFQRSLLIAVALAVLAAPLLAAPIHVKIRMNSCTVLDTFSVNHYVQIRGELNGQENVLLPDYKNVAWDETSGLVMHNVGGDYWEISFMMNPDDTLAYKFWTGFDENTGTSVVWDGWEGDITDPNGVSGNNRVLISGTTDTVVALQYYNGSSGQKNQYFKPYTAYPDSVAILFRVDMAGVEQSTDFDPAVDIPVKVYGGTPLGPSDDPWESFLTLHREATTGVGADFWSGWKYIATADLDEGTSQSYKFVYMEGGTSEAWEDNAPNRGFTVTADLASGAVDTTLHWLYFDDRAPRSGDMINTNVTWTMDPGALQDLGFFDRSVGDKILISGPKGWDIPDQAIEVTFQPLLSYWIGQEAFLKYPGDVLQYKYVILYDSSRVDTLSPNYIPGLPGVQLWEEPSSTEGANRFYTILNQADQQVPGDFGYDYQYYASIPPEGVIGTDMSVTFNVNMEPATDISVNQSDPLFRPGVDTPYIYFESPLLMLTQGLAAYGATMDLEDPDADGVYSVTMDFTAPFVYQVGFRVGYTTDEDDVLNGGGVQAGRRYYQFIWPLTHEPGGATVWPDTYDFPTIDWVRFELPSETPPDFGQSLSLADRGARVPEGWYLAPNYPNPFNPTTTLTYRVGAYQRVTLEVYSILGRKVRTLVDAPQRPGEYRTVWDGADGSGRTLASGVYFVRLASPSFSQVRRITLVR